MSPIRHKNVEETQSDRPGGTDVNREVELKFDVEPGSAERMGALRALAGLEGRSVQLESRYFDTPSADLRKAGMTLRVRQSPGRQVQTLKTRGGSMVGLYDRGEQECDLPGPDLDLGAFDPSLVAELERIMDGRPLRPVAATRFTRTLWVVARRDALIEVSLDQGEVENEVGRADLIELEMELVRGKPRDLFVLASEIASEMPLRLGVLSKSERALRLLDDPGQAAKARPAPIARGASEGTAFRRIAHECLRHYRLNEMMLLTGATGAPLHQARVALRRLRSALSLFRPTVSGKAWRQLREELGWLMGVMGTARDLDVLGGLDEEADLRTETDQAYARLRQALDSPRTRELFLRLAFLLEAGSWRFGKRAERNVAALAVAQLERQWRRVDRDSGTIATLAPHPRHRFRLQVKKLRYWAEFLIGLHPEGDPARRQQDFIAAICRLQEILGAMNDATLPNRRSGVTPDAGTGAARAAANAAERAMEEAGKAAGYWRAAIGARRARR